jgi:membrane protein
VGGAVLIFSGSRVFVELDDSFEVIWRGHRPTQVHPLMATVKSRLLALLLMVVLGVLMIAVIMSSVVLSAYAHVLTSFPVLGVWIGPAISGATHYGILTVFFTLLYKWLPTGGVPWRFALVSGAVNSLLFAVGNRALVYYFEVTNLTSAFGATAGFAAIMVWVYWTSLTILVGAQVGRAARDVFEAGEPRPEAAKVHH